MCVGIEIDESMDREDEEDSSVLLYRIASSCYFGMDSLYVRTVLSAYTPCDWLMSEKDDVTCFAT